MSFGRMGSLGKGFGRLGGPLGRTSGIPAWVQPGAVVDADFFNQRVYPGPAFTDELTDTRASDQYVPNADGSLVKKSSGVIPVSDAYMLIEPSGTNLIRQALSPDNASWSKRASLGFTTGLTAPDGTSTAQKFLESTANGNHDIAQTSSKPGGAVAQPFAFAAYVKPDERTFARLVFFDGSSVATQQSFTLTGAGTVGTKSDSGGGYTSFSSAIQAIANGWYRVQMVGTSSTTLSIETDLQVGVSDTGYFYTGVANSGLSMWGMDLKQSSEVTSLVVTTTAAATRAANAVKVTRTGIARIVFTFDDDSTQEVTGINTGAQYTIPTNLNRRRIKRMTGYAS